MSVENLLINMLRPLANSNGLPAVYLYLASKPKGLSIEMNFRLYLSEDTTELLTYNYGEGAKV